MTTFKVLVATVEREVYAGEAEKLVAPGSAGELGILPRHTPLLSELKAGELRISNGENIDEVFISGGYMEVQPDKVTILADTAERAVDIDEASALAAQRRAEERLESKKGSVDVALAEAEMAIMAQRLAWIQKKKRH